jgi:hypothetical protein
MASFALFLGLLVALLVSVATANEFSTLLWNSAKQFKQFAELELAKNGWNYTPSTYPWWNFFAKYQFSMAVPGEIIWTSPCFKANSLSLKANPDGKSYLLTLKAAQPINPEATCVDHYLAASTATFDWFSISTDKKLDVPIYHKEVTVTLPDDLTDAERWDLETKGVRIYRFAEDGATTVSNIIKTFELFVPEFTKRVPKAVAEMNIDMLQQYSKFEISARDPLSNLPPRAKDVKSGDFFGIMRLDGLNPLLGWAMGSTTGHTTVALWMDGELNVCESTIDDAYWPTDGVQCTPYDKWLKQCQEADFQVVWAPLSAEASAKFNETAAVEFFKSVEGLNYGFKTMLWSWLDTTSENFPCLPDDYTNCFSWELAETVLAYVDRKVPEIGYMMWNSGLAKRLGVSDTLRTAEILRESARQGIKSNDLITIPEQDTWVYNTTRFDEPAVGKNMVCCVFVCNMWKAAGVFGDMANDVQCGELTNWDDYALTILSDSPKQIIGDYTLELNDYGVKAPYAHMAETCPSLAPDYNRDASC